MKKSIILSIVLAIISITLFTCIIYLKNEIEKNENHIELLKTVLMDVIYQEQKYDINFNHNLNDIDEAKKVHEVEMDLLMPSEISNIVRVSIDPTEEFFKILDNQTKIVLLENNEETEMYFSEWLTKNLNDDSGDQLLNIEYILCDSDMNSVNDSMFVRCDNNILFIEGIDRIGNYFPALSIISINGEKIKNIFKDETIEIISKENEATYKRILYDIKTESYLDEETEEWIDSTYGFEFEDIEQINENAEVEEFIYYKTIMTSAIK